jgi:hypothetical protein
MLISCGNPEDQRYKADENYPFQESSKKSIKDLEHSKTWVLSLTTRPRNYKSGLEEAILELVPYSFTGEESFEVGELDVYMDDENIRYQVVVQINKILKVYLEVYNKRETPNSWDWMRVSAYTNGYRYLKAYNND